MKVPAGIQIRPDKIRWLWGLVVLVWICGCAPSYTLVREFESRKPRTVALLPVLNNTNDLDAPKDMRPLIYKALIGRGYLVQSFDETDALLKSREIDEAGQIYTMTYRELGDLLKSDALLVTTVLDWSTVYLIAYSSVTVEADFKLIDAQSEETLWESEKKVSKRNLATDKDSALKTLEDAIKIPYSSLAEQVISYCFATLPYGEAPKHPRRGKKRHHRRKVILPPGILKKL